MSDKDKKCEHTAVAAFPWGGKIINVCDVHLRAMTALNAVIGGVQTPRKIIGGKCEMPDDRDMYLAKGEE